MRQGAGGGDDVHRGDQEEPRAKEPSEEEELSASAAATKGASVGAGDDVEGAGGPLVENSSLEFCC